MSTLSPLFLVGLHRATSQKRARRPRVTERAAQARRTHPHKVHRHVHPALRAPSWLCSSRQPFLLMDLTTTTSLRTFHDRLGPDCCVRPRRCVSPGRGCRPRDGYARANTRRSLRCAVPRGELRRAAGFGPASRPTSPKRLAGAGTRGAGCRGEMLMLKASDSAECVPNSKKAFISKTMVILYVPGNARREIHAPW